MLDLDRPDVAGEERRPVRRHRRLPPLRAGVRDDDLTVFEPQVLQPRAPGEVAAGAESDR